MNHPLAQLTLPSREIKKPAAPKAGKILTLQSKNL